MREQEGESRKRPDPLGLAIMAERVLYFLGHPERRADNAKIVFGQASQFLEEVSLGQKAMGSLRLTPTSLKEIRTYRWWLNAFVGFEKSQGTTREGDLKVVLANQAAALKRFQESGIRLEDEAMATELKGVFGEILNNAHQALSEPTDRVQIGFPQRFS